jgi:hypothetical protein
MIVISMRNVNRGFKDAYKLAPRLDELMRFRYVAVGDAM